MHRSGEQRRRGGRAMLLVVAQPAIRRQGLFHIEAERLGVIRDWPKAKFQNQRRMLNQEAVQRRNRWLAFHDLDDQRLEKGVSWLRFRSRLGRIRFTTKR